MREGFNATLKVDDVNLPSDQSWVKLLDVNVQRTYLMIQNDQASHAITIGFGSNTVAPTNGFHLAGSSQTGHVDNMFVFQSAPINAVWAKVNDNQTHSIKVVYDD
tara:strand:- start:627 stop:941 length:315 start_codon:yes stop_codon:yes gene_type:complete